MTGEFDRRGPVAGQHRAAVLQPGGERLRRVVVHLVARMVAQRLGIDGVGEMVEFLGPP